MRTSGPAFSFAVVAMVADAYWVVSSHGVLQLFTVLCAFVLIAGIARFLMPSMQQSTSRRSKVTTVHRQMTWAPNVSAWLSRIVNTQWFNRSSNPTFDTGAQSFSSSFLSRSSSLRSRDDCLCSCGHGRSGAYTPRVATCSIETEEANNVSAHRTSCGRVWRSS